MSKQVKEILAQTALLRSNNLTLSNWKLKAFPEEACQFSWLVRVDLSYNQLSTLPPAFGSLVALRWLNLSSNAFTKVPIDQLGALSSLKYLQLSQNKVGDTLPMEMTKLISLEELDLSVNKIKAIGPNCLPKELSHLNISANEIAVLESNSDVFKCAHLEELLIANNKLTTISAQIEQLSALTLLDLSNNSLKSLPEQFGHIANLTDLNLTNNSKLVDLPPELGDLELKTIQLAGCKDLKCPPPELVKNGTPAILSFLQQLRQEKGKSSRFAAKGSVIMKTLRYYPSTADISDLLDLSHLEAEGVRIPESPVKRVLSSESSTPQSLGSTPTQSSLSSDSAPNALLAKVIQRQQSSDHSTSSSPNIRTDSPVRKNSQIEIGSPHHPTTTPPPGVNPKISAALQNRRPLSIGGGDPSHSAFPNQAMIYSAPQQIATPPQAALPTSFSSSPQHLQSSPLASSSLPPPPPSLSHHSSAAEMYRKESLQQMKRTDTPPPTNVSPVMQKIRVQQPKRSSVTDLFGDPDVKKPPLPPPQSTKPKQFPSQMTSSSGYGPILIPSSAFDFEQPVSPLSITEKSLGLFPSRFCNSYYTDAIHPHPHVTFLGMVSSTNQPMVISIVCEKEKDSAEYKAFVRTPEKDFRAAVPESVVKMPLLATRPSPAALLRALKESNPSIPVSGRFLKVGNPEIKDTMLLLEKRLQIAGMKVGVMYCKEGQTTEEEMYHNQSQHVSSAFQEFLELLGESVELMGWRGYAGGLQVTPLAPTTKGNGGLRSVYTRWRHADMRSSLEVMFHVAPLLRYVESDRQQLERKRHIGNDISVLVFIDSPNAGTAFAPANIRSEYNQVYIVIQALLVDGKRKYRVGVASKHGVPSFGPPLPDPPIFEPNEEFREFLLLKLYNAERASYTGPAFHNKICKTRLIFLKGLIDDYMDSKDEK